MSDESDEPVEFIPPPLSFALGWYRYHRRKIVEEIDRLVGIRIEDD